MQDNQSLDLDIALNLQTAKICWHELQRPFARGDIIWVTADLDLLDVAKHFIADDKQQVQSWLQENHISQPDSKLASKWYQENPNFWAVVVAPWVLIQPFEE